MSEFKVGQYFDMIGPTGDKRGRFKVLHTHLTRENRHLSPRTLARAPLALDYAEKN